MKKGITVIVVVLVLLLLVAPRFVGRGIESATVDTLLAMVPDQAGEVLSINQTDFQRGWFSSYSEIEITLDGLQEITGTPVTLVLAMDIDHGPLLFTPEGPRIGFAFADIDPYLPGIDMDELAADSEIDGNEPLITLFAGFDNSIQLGIEVDRFNAGNQQTQFGLTGLQGSNRILADLSGTATINVDTLNFESADESAVFDFAVQNLAISGAVSDMEKSVPLGSSSVSIAKINSTAPLPVVANDISVQSRTLQDSLSSDHLSWSQLVHIGELQWDLPLTSLQWRFQLDHLNRELLENYALLVQQTQQSAGTDPSRTAAQLGTLGQELALGLTGDSFSFENALELSAFDGDHRVQLNIDWPGLPGINSIEDLDIQQLLRTVQVTLALDADYTALMNSPFAQTVIDYERPGFLAIDNGRVISTIKLAAGMLDINGEITPLEQFVNL